MPSDSAMAISIRQMLTNMGENPDKRVRGGKKLWETWLPAFVASAKTRAAYSAQQEKQ